MNILMSTWFWRQKSCLPKRVIRPGFDAKAYGMMLCLLILTTLAGCGLKPKVVSVPQVLIQELHVSDRAVTARVLLHNFSNIEMTFSALNYRLNFGDTGDASAPVAVGLVPLELLVPMDSPESTTITLTLTPSALALLGAGKAFSYSISGTITSSIPSREFDFNYVGTLSPTPGKPGFWR
jgi:hypothetical protein